ncbi:Uncharacterized conserved protein involved in intracellular sulfur reduction [Mannheimia haemolytica]|uniref:Uncharacterized conserved protein involved in intracellular sulfur reduction n=1 Tax=Mannheimia haemolytica TaxID=75985 RepID=A0A378NAL4_MANHA|nr:Uncharacterized conserved protein involved in intracellular sulfur reduction [Mannheimia haemolytica]
MQSPQGWQSKSGRGLSYSANAGNFNRPRANVKLCKTCTNARGITDLPLADGVEIGTLIELADWTIQADKVLNF